MTTLKIECMYCHKNMGQKDGKGVEGTSHSICEECWRKRFPEWEYPQESKQNEQQQTKAEEATNHSAP